MPRRKTPATAPAKAKKPAREIVGRPTPKIDPATGKPEIPGQPGAETKIRRSQDGPLRVMATSMVYFEFKRRRAGNVFTLRTEDQFNPKCMEWVDPAMREYLTTGKDEVNRLRQEARGTMGVRATDPDDVL